MQPQVLSLFLSSAQQRCEQVPRAEANNSGVKFHTYLHRYFELRKNQQGVRGEMMITCGHFSFDR